MWAGKSLMLADGTVPPELTGRVAEFSSELAIEPTASTASPTERTFWLPLYFAQWRGLPLGTRDDTPHLLAGGSAAKAAGSKQPLLYGTVGRVNLSFLSWSEHRLKRIEDVPHRARIDFPNALAETRGIDRPQLIEHNGSRSPSDSRCNSKAK